MDRYELNVKMEQIKKLARQKEYAAAAKIADTIDFYRIKENKSLQLLADVYEASGKYNQAKEVLIEAYSRTTLGRQLAYRLVRLCIKSKNITEAEDFYDDFVNAAPKDNSKYILQYELATAKGRPLEERIKILETYLCDDMDEKWAFELAKMYHKTGQKEKCIRQCDDVILWFNDGKYVDRAMELKMLYKPLSKSQQEKYEKRWRAKAPSNINIDEIKVKEYDAANKYNTVNIENALKESMEVIMNEGDMYAEYSKAGKGKKQSDDLEKTKVVFSDEVVNSLLSHTIKDVSVPSKYNTVPLSPLLDMDSYGQIEMSIEDEPVDDQIEGQITIGELLDNYEKREAKLREQNEKQVIDQETKRLYNTEEIGSQIEAVIMDTDFDDEIEDDNISAELRNEEFVPDEITANEEDNEYSGESHNIKIGLGEKIMDATKDISHIQGALGLGATLGTYDMSYYSRPKESAVEASRKEADEAPQYAYTESTEETYEPSEEPQYSYTESTAETYEPSEEPQYSYTESTEETYEPSEAPQYSYMENTEEGYELDETPQYSYTENTEEMYELSEAPQYSYTENTEEGYGLDETPQYSYTENTEEAYEPSEAPQYSYMENTEEGYGLDETPQYSYEESTEETYEPSETPQYSYMENTEEGYGLSETPQYSYTENTEEGYGLSETPQYSYTENTEEGYGLSETPQYSYTESTEEAYELNETETPQYSYTENTEEGYGLSETPQYSYTENTEEGYGLSEDSQYAYKESTEEEYEPDEDSQYAYTENMEEEYEPSEDSQYAYMESMEEEYEPDEDSQYAYTENTEEEYESVEGPKYIFGGKKEASFDDGEEDDIFKETEKALSEIQRETEEAEAAELMPDASDRGTQEKSSEENDSQQNSTGEVKELIKDFVAKYSGVQGLDRQLLTVLQQVLINHNTKLIVMGEVKSGKTALAIDLVKIINKIHQTRGRKIAKINGEVLNEGNVSEYFEKLAGMDIIVEKAGSLKSMAADKIIDETEKEGSSRIIVLEDEKTSIEAFLKENRRVDEMFMGRVVVKQNNLQDWALVARRYANSQGYDIDEMGILALHARINELYAFSLLIGKKQVEEIVDNAIKRSKNRKIGRLLKLFGKEREKKLKEEDFS